MTITDSFLDRSINFLTVVLILLITLQVASCTNERTSDKEKFPKLPTVTNAFDLIESFPERLPVGSSVAFKVKQEPSAQSISTSGVLVRVFSLGKYDKTPQTSKETDDCFLYKTTVFNLDLQRDGTLKIGAFSSIDKSWLNLSNSKKSVQSSSWYFVFERGGTEASKIEEFGIKKTDVDSYFKTGFKVTIEDESKTIKPEEIRAAFDVRQSRLDEFRLKKVSETDSIPCYSYQPLNVNTIAGKNWTGVMTACSESVDHNHSNG